MGVLLIHTLELVRNEHVILFALSRLFQFRNKENQLSFVSPQQSAIHCIKSYFNLKWDTTSSPYLSTCIQVISIVLPQTFIAIAHKHLACSTGPDPSLRRSRSVKQTSSAIYTVLRQLHVTMYLVHSTCNQTSIRWNKYDFGSSETFVHLQ
jgi:hypothetical protein